MGINEEVLDLICNIISLETIDNDSKVTLLRRFFGDDSGQNADSFAIAATERSEDEKW